MYIYIYGDGTKARVGGWEKGIYGRELNTTARDIKKKSGVTKADDQGCGLLGGLLCMISGRTNH